jgi:hypothetical protein
VVGDDVDKFVKISNTVSVRTSSVDAVTLNPNGVDVHGNWYPVTVDIQDVLDELKE